MFANWKSKVLSEHLVYIKGVELVYFEFKELLLELALRLKDHVDSAPGKLRSLIKKFLDELFLKRLNPFIKFNVAKKATANAGSSTSAASRAWPESAKDQAIKVIMEEKRKQEAEEQRLQEEERQKQAEVEAEALADKEAQEALQAAEDNKADAEDEAKRGPADNAGGSAAEEDDEDDDDADLEDVADEESDY